MNLPEYLVLFSNKGAIDINVKFADPDVMISPRTMRPQEFAALVTTDGAGFHQRMTFDEHTFSIQKYEIDPNKNTLTIFVKKAI
jgi:hypothetical protein